LVFLVLVVARVFQIKKCSIKVAVIGNSSG
jgi:hypothetical protein